jgi:hypothetical protein
VALAAIAHGHVVMGALVIVAAKILGTAVVARLFTITRPTLMRLRWFAACYARWLGWKESLLAEVRRTRAWRQVRVLRRQVGRRLPAWRRASKPAR